MQSSISPGSRLIGLSLGLLAVFVVTPFLLGSSPCLIDCTGTCEDSSNKLAWQSQRQRDAREQLEPQRTPDGNYIVFAHDGDIYRISLDGTELQLISDDEDRDYSPSLSADGTLVVYTTLTPSASRNEDYEIAVTTIGGGQPKRLTDNEQDDVTPVWSPDGRKIAFVREGDLYLMNSDGSEQRSLAPGLDLGNTAPIWSPDGSKLAFFVQEQIPGTIHYLDLYNLYEPPAKRTSTAWAYKDSTYVVNADSTGLVKLEWAPERSAAPRTRMSKNDLYLPDERVSALVWAPDSERLAIVAGLYGESDVLYTMKADGSELQPVFTFEHGDLYGSNYMSLYQSRKDSGEVTPLMEEHGIARYLDRHYFSEISWSGSNSVLHFTVRFDRSFEVDKLGYPHYFAVDLKNPILHELTEQDHLAQYFANTGRVDRRQVTYHGARSWYGYGVLTVSNTDGRGSHNLVELVEGRVVPANRD